MTESTGGDPPRPVLVTRGTLGDHLPMVGLGVELARRGLRPRIACNPAMHPLVARAGLEALAWDGPLGPTEAGRAATDWDHWRISPADVRWSEALTQQGIRLTHELLARLGSADLLIAAANVPFAALVAAALRIPWVEIGLNPASCIDHERRVAEGAPRHDWLRGVAATADHLCTSLKLPPEAARGEPNLRLHAVPAEFVPLEYPQKPAHATGFWMFEDPLWSDWQPSAALESLVAGERRPLALAFSSQPLADPLGWLEAHLRVAELLDRALLVPSSWALAAGGGKRSLPDSPRLHLLDPLPYGWLFRHVDAAFIHGGIGTLATGLAAGCPLVVEPLGHDQFLNARHLLRSGRGIAVHPHRLEPRTVANALSDLWSHHPPGSGPPPWAGEGGSGLQGLSIAATRILAAGLTGSRAIPSLR